jgi:hypothetical protein
MIPHRPGSIVLLLLACAACAGKEAPAAQPTPVPAESGDGPAPAIGRGPALSPLADTIAQSLVFLPRNQTWFTAAARGKRMLLDLGRVDVEVRRDSARAQAYREAVTSLSPLAAGTRLRLYGRWGADDIEITGFDTWNGRIVATLRVPERVESIAKHVEPLPAAAHVVDAETPPTSPPCARDSVSLEHLRRLDALRDSLEDRLRAESVIPYERLVPTVAVRTTMAVGCYGKGRTIIVTSLRAGGHDFVREKFVLVSENGAITPMRLGPSRWRAHEAIFALDGDGDGVDDLAVKGSSDRAGGMVILKLVNGNRLEKLTGGFNWETR